MRVYRFDNHGGLDGLHIHDEPVPSPQRHSPQNCCCG